MEPWILPAILVGLWAGNRLASAVLRTPLAPVAEAPPTLEVRVAVLALFACPGRGRDGAGSGHPLPAPSAKYI